MKISTDDGLDRLERAYRDGPVHEVLMELRRMRHARDNEPVASRRAGMDKEIAGWAGGLPELIYQIERE